MPQKPKPTGPIKASVFLHRDLHHALTVAAAEQRKTLSDLVAAILAKKFKVSVPSND